MRLAYVTRYDATNIQKWSGTPYYMAKQLKDNGVELDYLGPLKKELPPFFKWKNTLKKLVSPERTKSTYLPYVLQRYADQVSKKLQHSTADAVLAPVMEPLAYLDSDKPLFVWTDAVFASLLGFYPKYFDLGEDTIRAGNAMAAACLQRCKLVFFSSQWAADAAYHLYGTDPAKCRVAPFGANIEDEFSLEEIKTIIHQRNQDKINLLLVGVEWERKGVDVAINVAKELHNQGYPVTLTIVGIKPTHLKECPDYLRFTGFISKHTDSGKKQLTDLFCHSHFLLFPSRGEAYGIVCCEANAYGVPCITSCVGGITTIIKNNVNGFALPFDGTVTRYCDTIIRLFENKSQYNELCLSAYHEYQTRLNWKTATTSVIEAIKGVLP